jgi:hypothetical protein
MQQGRRSSVTLGIWAFGGASRIQKVEGKRVRRVDVWVDG